MAARAAQGVDATSLVYEDDLEEAKPEIRLITLCPGRIDDEVICSLHKVSLDGFPEFEALSYTWGDPDDTLKVTINSCSFDVTVNLEAALRHLRHESKARVLWADAICINQHNVNERNSQVRQMGKIYESASGVIVWLGPQCDEMLPVLEIVDLVTSSDNVHWSRNRPNSIMNTVSAPNCLDALEKLFTLPWWNRVWTVQETLLAKDLNFMYGRRSIPKLIEVAVHFLSHAANCCLDLREEDEGRLIIKKMRSPFDNANMLHSFRSWQQSKSAVERNHEITSLLFIMANYRFRECKDARDRIYGFLGLVGAVDKNLIEVNYLATVQEVFVFSALKLIKKHQNLDIMTQLGHHYTDSSHKTPGIPSWVPDWGAMTDFRLCAILQERLKWLSLYQASGTTFQVPTLIDSSKLIVNGFMIDVLDWVGECPSRESSASGNAQWRAQIKDWRAKIKRSSSPDKPYIHQKGCDIYDAFWQTLCSGVIYESLGGNSIKIIRIHKEEHRPCFEAAYARFIDSKDYAKATINLDYISSLASHKVLDHLGRSIPMRCFFLTKSGHMGLAPGGAKPGDKAVVLCGGSVPYIIRETMESHSIGEQCFPISKLIGDCYIHGMMDGEAVVDSRGEIFILA